MIAGLLAIIGVILWLWVGQDLTYSSRLDSSDVLLRRHRMDRRSLCSSASAQNFAVERPSFRAIDRFGLVILSGVRSTESKDCGFTQLRENHNLMPDTILVVAEQREGKLNRVSFETIAAAQAIAKETGWSVEVVLPGNNLAHSSRRTGDQSRREGLRARIAGDRKLHRRCLRSSH